MLLRSYKTIISGSVTQANMRISAVDGGSTASGGAFLDFSLAGSLTPYIGDYIVIKDSTGKTIEGWIKAAGVSEGLASTGGPLNDGNLITNPGFEGVYVLGTAPNWTKVRGTNTESVDVHSGSAAQLMSNPTGNSAYTSQAITLSDKALYKFTGWEKTAAGSGGDISVSKAASPYTAITPTTAVNNVAYAQFSLYGIAVATENYTVNIRTISNAVADVNQAIWDDFSVKQVLTPSATGVTITSLQDGTLYNWPVKTTGFNYNDSSGYTYKIQARLLVGGMGGGYVR